MVSPFGKILASVLSELRDLTSAFQRDSVIDKLFECAQREKQSVKKALKSFLAWL
jgi:hypothetical protein